MATPGGSRRTDESCACPTSTKIFWPDEGYTKGDLLAYYFNVAPLIAAAPGRAATHDEAHARRHRRSFLLREVGPVAHARLAWAMRRCRPRNRRRARSTTPPSPTPRVCSTSPTWGVSSSTRCIPRCSDVAAPRLPVLRSGSVPAVHLRGRADRGTAHQGAHGSARPAVVPQDERPRPGCRSTSRSTEAAYTYEQVRAFVGVAGLAGQTGADPDRVTMAWKIADRTGKIFIDHNMNRSGANISAAYSVCPGQPRAPVSTPLTWDEVAPGRVRAAGLPYRQCLGSIRRAWATCSTACGPRPWI